MLQDFAHHKPGSSPPQVVPDSCAAMPMDVDATACGSTSSAAVSSEPGSPVAQHGAGREATSDAEVGHCIPVSTHPELVLLYSMRSMKFSEPFSPRHAACAASICSGMRCNRCCKQSDAKC